MRYHLVKVESLLEKQYAPLNTQPVVSVSDIKNADSIEVIPIVCPVCLKSNYSKPDYVYCPYCGNNIREVYE